MLVTTTLPAYAGYVARAGPDLTAYDGEKRRLVHWLTRYGEPVTNAERQKLAASLPVSTLQEVTE